RYHGPRLDPVSRHVRYPPHARGIFRPRPYLALHRGRDRLGARASSLRCDPTGSSRADRRQMQCRVTRLRSSAPRDRSRRLPHPAIGASARKAMRRCGPLHPLGATTQDIMDTAVALQIREALTIIEQEIDELRRILAKMATKYRDTPM